MKEMTVVADHEVVLTQTMLREAVLHGRLRLVIGQGKSSCARDGNGSGKCRTGAGGLPGPRASDSV